MTAVSTRKPDSPVAPGAVAVLLFLCGLGMLIAASGIVQEDTSERAMLDAALALALAGVATGLLSLWSAGIARWFIVMVLVTLAEWAPRHFGQPAFLGLSVVAVLAAGLLVNVWGALGVAIVESFLLGWSAAGGMRGPDPAAAIVPGVLSWLVVAAYAALYRYFHQYDRWLWEYYERAYQVVEEAQKDRLELKESRLALEQANRQLLLAAKRTSLLRVAAEASEKSKTMFVSKVSHEFRTPLNMIIGLVGLIFDEQAVSGVRLPRQLQEDLRVVYRNCQHLSRMVDDVLSLSQIESGRLMLYKEPVDLASLVKTSIEVILPLVEAKQLDLEATISPDLPAVYCDRTRIQQVILNLLSNAARFTQRGTIAIRVGCKGPLVEVSVADTGPGISSRDAERIFEPFDQGTGELWRDKGGSGLGLSISRQFVKLHGGRIWLESEQGVGSCFRFELPISPLVGSGSPAGGWIREDWVWRERAFEASRAALEEEPLIPRVVVYDETGSLNAELRRLPNVAEFVTAGTLADALDEVEHCPARALLLNVDSRDDLWQVVDNAARDVSHTPVVGCCLPRSVQRAIDAGASDYLVKPVLPEDLQRVLGEVNGNVRRVLVVDDDPDLLDVFVRMLKVCDHDIDVVTASTGEQALSCLRREKVDLIFLDLVLPGMDGWQVLNAGTRSETTDDNVPVVIISAQDPGDQLMASSPLLATMGAGLTADRLLQCALGVSTLLLSPRQQLHPGLVETRDG